jgi:hypothetical protein
MSGVPAEIGWCVYVRGGEDSSDPDKGAFVVEYHRGMDTFRYVEIARDEDGVYLLAENGESTRIEGGAELFEDAGDLSLVRLEIRTPDYDLVDDYDIRRAPDQTVAYGA